VKCHCASQLMQTYIHTNVCVIYIHEYVCVYIYICTYVCIHMNTYLLNGTMLYASCYFAMSPFLMVYRWAESGDVYINTYMNNIYKYIHEHYIQIHTWTIYIQIYTWTIYTDIYMNNIYKYLHEHCVTLFVIVLQVTWSKQIDTHSCEM